MSVERKGNEEREKPVNIQRAIKCCYPQSLGEKKTLGGRQRWMAEEANSAEIKLEGDELNF